MEGGEGNTAFHNQTIACMPPLCAAEIKCTYSPAMHRDRLMVNMLAADQFDHLGDAEGHGGHSVVRPGCVLVLAYLLNTKP